MNQKSPLRVAIAGIGGFGSSHHAVFSGLEAQGRVRVVATCDPAQDRLGEICARHRFSERGVRVYAGFEEMMAAHAGQLDLGVVATPPHCHAGMHQALVEAGIPCYLEKPPTLDPEEFERMVEVESHAASPTNVGFCFVHDHARLALKQRILDGEFGALQRSTFLGLVQRTPGYFQRSRWAARLLLDGKLLLDSCLGNAMSHYVNNLLFFSGLDSLAERARPLSASCELYRANEIEGTDTIFVSGVLRNGEEFRMAASHACPSATQLTEEVMVFDRATIIIRGGTGGVIQWGDRAPEEAPLSTPALSSCMDEYLAFLGGRLPRPPQTLEECRGFVEMNALFYLASGPGIHNVPDRARSRNPETQAVVITGIEEAGRTFLAQGTFPSQAGHSWGRRGGAASVEALPDLLSRIQHCGTQR